MLEYFSRDAHTRVIAIHLEALQDGRRFVEAARRVSLDKPVVYKAGRTAVGVRSAASHTGAMVGSDRVYDAAFRKSGVLRARTLDELFDWSRALEVLPPPQGNNVLIHTSAGGLGVILANSVSEQGLTVMEVPEDLMCKLRDLIPTFGSCQNPVDVTGSSTPEIQAATAKIAIRDPRVHSIIFGYWHTIFTPPMVYAKVLGEVVEDSRREGIAKPVVATLSGDVEVEKAATYLNERGIPSYPYTPERAVSSLAAKYAWVNSRYR